MSIKNQIFIFFVASFSILLWIACDTAMTPNSKQYIPVKAVTFDTVNTPTSKAVVQPMIDTSIHLDYLMGKFDQTTHPEFVKIGLPYAEESGMYLRKEVYEAFKKMYTAAKEENVELLIRSATRNFARQKVIWEGKWKGSRKLEGGVDASKEFPKAIDRAREILKWSSMPGSSRHHWGTDIDINSFINSYFEKGRGKKEYDWLVQHAATFGFCQPYTPKGTERPYGYNEEKWHWSYMPLSRPFTQQCELRLKDEMIEGFLGAEVAKEIGIVDKYVLGINKACQ